MLAQSLTSVWVLSIHSQVPAAGAAPYGDRVCAYPLLRPKLPESPTPSTSRLLSSALPRPCHCRSHIWAGSAQGPQWCASVATAGVSADSAPQALEAANPSTVPPTSTSGYMGPQGYGSTMLLFQEAPRPPNQGTPVAPPTGILTLKDFLNLLLYRSLSLGPRNLLPPLGGGETLRRVTLIIPLPLDRTRHLTCFLLFGSPTFSSSNLNSPRFLGS